MSRRDPKVCDTCGVRHSPDGDALCAAQAAHRERKRAMFRRKYGALEAALEAAGIEPELLREWIREERL